MKILTDFNEYSKCLRRGRERARPSKRLSLFTSVTSLVLEAARGDEDPAGKMEAVQGASALQTSTPAGFAALGEVCLRQEVAARGHGSARWKMALRLSCSGPRCCHIPFCTSRVAFPGAGNRSGGECQEVDRQIGTHAGKAATTGGKR